MGTKAGGNDGALPVKASPHVTVHAVLSYSSKIAKQGVEGVASVLSMALSAEYRMPLQLARSREGADSSQGDKYTVGSHRENRERASATR